MSKLKVLEIMTHNDPGGIRTHVEALVAEFKRDQAIEVVLAYGGEHTRVSETDGIQTYVIGGLEREISPLKDLKAVVALYRLCRKGRFDIVHSHGPKAGFLGRFAAFLAGVPVIVHTHHGLAFHEFVAWPKRRLYATLERMAGWITTYFISVAEYNVQKLVSQKICQPQCVSVIPNGIDLGKFAPKFQDRQVEISGISEGDLVIGSITRMDPFKNVEMLVEVAERLHANNPAIKLLLVGGGPSFADIQALVKARCAGEYIVMTGPRHDVPQLLQRIDIFVFSSKLEGLPYSIIEAMAASKPVVSTAVGGIPEIIEHGKSGFLINNFDPAQFAEYVERLAQDPELRNWVGEQALARVRINYDVQTMAVKVKQLLLKLRDEVSKI